ncbi:MAG: hypothetical protein K6B72_00505 [Lachnospiraceae bacterium]|nr:hypothetical protein [Lachnospiraceae bacterium]
MALEDLQDVVESDLPYELGDRLAEKAREHGEAYHNIFCWNCGKGVAVAKLSRCKNCGAAMNGPWRFDSPCSKVRPEHPWMFARSYRRFRRRSIIGLIIFGIIVTAIIAGVMVFANEEFDINSTEDVRGLVYVVIGLWILWIAALFYQFFDTARKIRHARAGNRDPRNTDNECAMCGTLNDKRANYCGLCGCSIPK